MAQAAQKITLSSSRDIPFDKLVLSQSNVRRIKAGVSVEELAEDIARRGLLQGLSVRPVLDADGIETGKLRETDDPCGFMPCATAHFCMPLGQNPGRGFVAFDNIGSAVSTVVNICSSA